MPRHIPRSHLRSHLYPAIYGSACGSPSIKVLSKSQFLKASDRCQKCDRIAQGLGSTAGRKKPEGGGHIVAITGLDPRTLALLEELASEGKAGETIGRLANKYLRRSNNAKNN